MKVIPNKGAIVTGLVVFALGMFLYNKVGVVRKALGSAV